MTRPKCKNCKTKFDRYAIFSSKVEGSSPDKFYATLDSNYRNYCIDCFIKNNYDAKIDGFVGILNRTDYGKYRDRCDINSPFKELQTQGIVKLNLQDYKPLQSNLNYLRTTYLSKVDGKQMDELPDNFEDGKKYHPQRVWKQLYPKDTTNNGISKKKDDDFTLLCCLRMSVEEIISPHEYFARLAKKTFGQMLKKVSKKNQIQGGERNLKREGLEDNILRLRNVNMLARGPELDADQQPHVDSLNDDLILIMPILSQNGYPIKCFKTSHLINHEKLKEMIGAGDGAVTFPLSFLGDEIVRANEVIILYENTIHCGGRSSAKHGIPDSVKSKEDLQKAGTRVVLPSTLWDQLQKVHWFRGNEELLPTDISIQFTFENSITKFNDTHNGRAQPRWIYNVGECIEWEDKWKESVDEDEYQTKQSEATARYFNGLFNIRSSSRKRQR